MSTIFAIVLLFPPPPIGRQFPAEEPPKYKKLCIECWGKRKIECQKCEGRWRRVPTAIVCRVCDAKGLRECGKCHGTGLVSCRVCFGTGRDRKDKTRLCKARCKLLSGGFYGRGCNACKHENVCSLCEGSVIGCKCLHVRKDGRRLAFTRRKGYRPCKACDGSGDRIVKKKCSHCDKGKIECFHCRIKPDKPKKKVIPKQKTT